MSRKATTTLSEVKVLLNNEGNIEVEYSNVPLEAFTEAMEKKLPEYENTHVIASFMKKLQRVTTEYYRKINRLLI